MEANYANAYKAELIYEGGKVDDPQDPGGRTNKGVTQRVYNSYRSRRGLPPNDVYNITSEECAAIYKAQYWDAIKGDKLPAGVDFVVFDGAVNSGPQQSIKWLQRALGLKQIDGVIGEATLDAVESNIDNDRLISDILDRRMVFLKSLKTFSRFGKGWASRVNQVKSKGQAWASGSVGPEPVSVEAINGHRKALISDAKPEPMKALADVTTTAGGGSFSVGTVLSATKEQLDPLAASSDLIAKIVMILVIAGAVIGIGGAAFSYYQRQKTAERADALDLSTNAVTV